MLDASLSSEEARQLVGRALEQGILSTAVVCMGYATFCGHVTQYYRVYWRTDHQLYKLLVTVLLVVLSMYTITLFTQTALLARAIVEDPSLTVNTLPLWYSWLHIALRSLLGPVGAGCEAFFLMRASKAAGSKTVQIIFVIIFAVSATAWIATDVLSSVEIATLGQPWSFRVSVMDCVAAFGALAMNLGTALVLVHQLFKTRVIRVRPTHDILRVWYQGAIKTSLIAAVSTLGMSITSCFVRSHLASITFNFWIHLYVALVSVSTVYALNSRERIKGVDPRAHNATDATLGYSMGELPSFVARPSTQARGYEVEVELAEEERCERDDAPDSSSRRSLETHTKYTKDV